MRKEIHELLQLIIYLHIFSYDAYNFHFDKFRLFMQNNAKTKMYLITIIKRIICKYRRLTERIKEQNGKFTESQLKWYETKTSERNVFL